MSPLVAIAAGDGDAHRAGMEIGERIREARERARLTQGQLATKIGATSNMAVYRWESGAKKPSTKWLPLLAGALDVSVEWLLVGDAARAQPSDEPTLSDEVLALCDAMGVRRPDADETRWLLAEPQFHRRAPIAVVDTLRAHRNGLTPEQIEASERATAAHRDPSVPRRKR